jgi:hypothetical protein
VFHHIRQHKDRLLLLHIGIRIVAVDGTRGSPPRPQSPCGPARHGVVWNPRL